MNDRHPNDLELRAGGWDGGGFDVGVGVGRTLTLMI